MFNFRILFFPSDTTLIDGKQSQAFLEQTQKYLDKNVIEKQVDELVKAKKYATKIR
ncbi:hypothetical protein [Capnocytophaga canimorsus]|uniref:hypothetical protein n=1 Tax=Capnocytophaga canimorsus TaxID=28188 RepID=UPI0012FF60CD|nr:hypothetical protein [Capnocytophaga canimorsus]